jgi:energy-coupling factor transport system substrate-specific component
VGPYPLHHSHDAARLLTASVGSDALLPAGVLVPLPPAAIPPFDRQSSSGREAAGITAVKGRVWSIHISHIVAMIIGAILFGLLSHMIVYWHFNTSGSNFLNDGFAFPAIVISLFFGALFGPWVGAISGGLGAFIGDYILMFYPDLFANHSMLSNGIWHGSPLANVLVWIGFTSSSNTNWAWIVSNALMGFIAGLAMMGTRGRYVTLARVALAELMAAIGVLAGLGLLIVNKAWDPGLPYNNFIHFSTIDVLNIGFAHIILPTLALALTALSLLLPLTNALTHSREKST